jgi:predicted MFS family arabinose efflux permease
MIDRSIAHSAARITLSAFLALAVAMGIGRFAFTPLLPMMMNDSVLNGSGMSLAEGGWLATGNYIGYLLGALTAARLPAKHTGAFLRGSLLAVIITTALMAWSSHFAAWLLWRTLAGVASALILVQASAWALQELARLQRSDLSARIFAGVGTGITLTGLLVLVLSALHADASLAWLLCGVLALGMSAVAWRGLPVKMQVVPTVGTDRNAFNARDRRFILCYGLYGLGYIIPATFLPALAREAMPDPLLFNWVWPVFGAVALIGTLFVGRMRHRWTPLGIWSGSHLIMGAGVAILVLPHSMPAILVSALCVGSTFIVVTLAGFQTVREVAANPAHATRLIAAMTAAFAAGQIAGPLLLAWSQPRWGVNPSLLLAAAALLWSGVALWRIPRVAKA